MKHRTITHIKNSFVHKIESGQIYVDKTSAAWELISNNKFAFAEARKGAGKTLLLDTIEAIFSQDYQLFQGLELSSQLAHLPYVKVVYIDGEQWMNKAKYYLEYLQKAMYQPNVVVLFDNLHVLKESYRGFSNPNIQSFFSILKLNRNKIRLAVLFAEYGHLNGEEKDDFSQFNNISKANYVLNAFHFSLSELKKYYEKSIIQIADETGLNSEDIFEYILQNYRSSCCNGVSPTAFLRFLNT